MPYAIPESVHFNQVDNEVVILDEASDCYLALNEVGATIWGAIVDGLDLADIAGRVVARFEVDSEQAVADATEFVSVLLERGLVRVQLPGSPQSSK